MSLYIHTFQDAITQSKKVLRALGIDFIEVVLEDYDFEGHCTLYSDKDKNPTQAYPGDMFRVHQYLEDMPDDLPTYTFFDRASRFLFTITPNPIPLLTEG